MPTQADSNGADSVRTSVVLWSLLTLVEVLANVRVDSVGGWSPTAADSMLSFTKSPIVCDGRPLTLGGQGTVKGTLARHLPHVSDRMIDRNGADKNGRKYAIVNEYLVEGKKVTKSEFLTAAKALIVAANDDGLTIA